MIEDYCPEKAISFTIPIVGLPAKSVGVASRPLHKLAPSVRPFSGILSVVAMFRQLSLASLYGPW